MKHLLKMGDLTPKDIDKILNLAVRLKSETKNGIIHHELTGKTLGMIFSKSSTRTRVSFEIGMYQLGGYSLFLNSNDIQIGRGEIIEDTAKVLSRYLDAIMIRTADHKDVEALAEHGTIPVINGLTDLEHPCQILADLLTIREHKGVLKGLKVAYIGDGNNVANSLLSGCVKAGMNISIATPMGYECDPATVKTAVKEAKTTGSTVVFTNDPKVAACNADVLYTDTWVSMGQESGKEEKIRAFKGFQVNEELFTETKADAIFMHCLPAYRGYEVSAEIIDGARSVVIDEAENRLHAQKAVLVLLMKQAED